MICNEILTGKYVTARSATLDDAEYTLKIRQDQERNKFLHSVENNLDQQKAWLSKQIDREGDLFFIISDLHEHKVGTIGLYDIKDQKGHLGRVLMFGSPILTFEASILICDYGFNQLGLNEIFGDVDQNNTASLSYSKALGIKFGELKYDPELNRNYYLGSVFKHEFPKYKKELEQMIYR